MKKKIGGAVVAGVMAMALAGCGDAEIEKVDKDVPTEQQDKEKEQDKAKESKYKIGDTVSVNGVEITLNEVRYEQGGEFDNAENGKFIVINMTAENTTDEEANISSIGNVTFKDAEGYKHTQTIVMEGTKGQFDGTLESGGTLRGEIVYDVGESESYEVQYEELFSSGKAIWSFTPGDITE